LFNVDLDEMQGKWTNIKDTDVTVEFQKTLFIGSNNFSGKNNLTVSQCIQERLNDGVEFSEFVVKTVNNWY